MNYGQIKHHIRHTDCAATVWAELIGVPVEVFKDVSFNKRGGLAVGITPPKEKIVSRIAASQVQIYV